MTRVLVTGGQGMLGTALRHTSAPAGIVIIALGRAELDIAEAGAVARGIASHAPDLVINAAGYTAVDQAEKEPQLAQQVNGDAPGHLAQACKQRNIPLVHISTDYVFDGMGARPYRPDDPTGPMNVYGRTKLAGEEAVRAAGASHLIIRTAWVYASHGRNFLRTMIRLAETREELRVVADQTGSPTSATDLARAVLTAGLALANRPDLSGTYHFTNAGRTSWHGFAQAIVEGIATRPGTMATRVTPITTAEYPVPARRPPYSVLDCDSFIRAFQVSPRPWLAALDDVLLETLA